MTQKTDSAENFLFHRKKTPINHPTRNLLSKESQKIQPIFATSNIIFTILWKTVSAILTSSQTNHLCNPHFFCNPFTYCNCCSLIFFPLSGPGSESYCRKSPYSSHGPSKGFPQSKYQYRQGDYAPHLDKDLLLGLRYPTIYRLVKFRR